MVTFGCRGYLEEAEELLALGDEVCREVIPHRAPENSEDTHIHTETQTDTHTRTHTHTQSREVTGVLCTLSLLGLVCVCLSLPVGDVFLSETRSWGRPRKPATIRTETWFFCCPREGSPIAQILGHFSSTVQPERDEVFTLGDARSFFALTSKIPPLGSMLNFDADVKKSTARH